MSRREAIIAAARKADEAIDQLHEALGELKALAEDAPTPVRSVVSTLTENALSRAVCVGEACRPSVVPSREWVNPVTLCGQFSID